MALPLASHYNRRIECLLPAIIQITTDNITMSINIRQNGVLNIIIIALRLYICSSRRYSHQLLQVTPH